MALDLGTLKLIDGGYRVKTTEWCHVDVMKMIAGNWRLTATSLTHPDLYNRAWCYTAADSPASNAFVAAVLAANAWDGSPDSEPLGWYRALDGTHRRRPGGVAEAEFIAP